MNPYSIFAQGFTEQWEGWYFIWTIIIVAVGINGRKGSV